jgi:hypothetical protein
MAFGSTSLGLDQDIIYADNLNLNKLLGSKCRWTLNVTHDNGVNIGFDIQLSNEWLWPLPLR